MSDAMLFFQSCIQAGALLGSLCAILIVPPAVWLVVSHAKAHILQMNADRSWQAPFAAVGSMLPGASFLSIAGYGIAVGARSSCLQFATGRMIFGALLLLTIGAVARAMWMAFTRSRESAMVRFASCAPSERLRSMTPANCEARLIADPHPFCAVLGIVRPVLVVSTGALGRLDDEELRAAIAHEAAHVQRCDPLLGALAAFFSDLFPFGSGSLLNAYWEAREFAADQHALAQTKAEALAGAIIAMAKVPKLGVAALGGGTVTGRLDRLLKPSDSSVSPRERNIAGATLVLAGTIALLPIAAGAFGFLSCHSM